MYNRFEHRPLPGALKDFEAKAWHFGLMKIFTIISNILFDTHF